MQEIPSCSSGGLHHLVNQHAPSAFSGCSPWHPSILSCLQTDEAALTFPSATFSAARPGSVNIPSLLLVKEKAAVIHMADEGVETDFHLGNSNNPPAFLAFRGVCIPGHQPNGALRHASHHSTPQWLLDQETPHLVP